MAFSLMRNDLDILFEFPCRFPVKAMGRNDGDFEAIVTSLVLRHARLFESESVRLQPSAEGNFLSVTVTIEAESRDQLDQIYHDLTDCERVLMAL